MSLDFRFSKIANFKAVCWMPDGGMNPVTEALIWRCMSLDLGEITEKNWEEFEIRSRIYSRCFGEPLSRVVTRCPECDKECPNAEKCGHCSAWTVDKSEPFDFTVEEIKTHIGLSTNVSNKSRKQFLSKVAEILNREAESSFRYEQEKPAAVQPQLETKE